MSNVDDAVARFHEVFPAPAQHQQFVRFRNHVLDRDNPVVFELGGGDGISTVMFLSGGAEVWSVDCDNDGNDWDGNYHFLRADDLSQAAQDWFPAQCDVLFIDSAHTKEHTIKELDLYAPRVKAGGVILLHDTHYGQDGNELPEPTGEVAQALTEWCKANNRTWEDYPGSYGLGVVWIDDANV